MNQRLTNIPAKPPSDDTQPEPIQQTTPPVSRNFSLRYLSSVTIIPLTVVGLLVGEWLWWALVSVLALVGLLEFYSLARGRPSQGITWIGTPAGLSLILAFHMDSALLGVASVVLCVGLSFGISWRSVNNRPVAHWKALITLCGLLYVALPLAFLVELRQVDTRIHWFEAGFLWLIVVIGLTWGTDTLAYFGGKLFGRHKLAPRLSPEKTVEGALFGMVGGFIIALLFLLRTEQLSTVTLMMIVIAPGAAVIGDLLESALKRGLQVKDTRLPGLDVIPGHGGVLDRIDALLVVTAFCYIYLLLAGLL